MMKNCPWPANDPLMIKYHDEEWGKPLHDDRKLFEFLILESFQAGLSWRTVLHKRENFRRAFANFDAKKVSKFDRKKFNSLMKNAGIIRGPGNRRRHVSSRTKSFVGIFSYPKKISWKYNVRFRWLQKN